MLQRSLASVLILAFVCGTLPALGADELSGKLVGTWVWTAPAGDHDQYWAIANDGGKWTVKGWYKNDQGVETGSFIGVDVTYAHGVLSYTHRYIKKNFDYKDNVPVMIKVGGALVKYYWDPNNPQTERILEKRPDATLAGNESAKPKVPQRPDAFVGTWKTKAKFAGYDQIVTIGNDSTPWSIHGTFQREDAVVGTFIGEDVRWAGGLLTYRSKFVRKPVASWQDDYPTLRMEGDTLLMSFVTKTGENIVRAFQRLPSEPPAAAKTAVNEPAKLTLPTKPAEKPGGMKKGGAGAAVSKTAPQRSTDQLTQENFNRITNGMTKDEVCEILGANRSSAGQGSSLRLGWYFSGDAAHGAEVQFLNGKVVSKHSAIDWSKHGGKTAPAAPAASATANGKPAEEAKPPVVEDKLATAIAALQSGTAGQKRKALAFLAKAPRDEERAAAVSRLIQKCLTGKDEFVKLAARGAIEPWATRENSAYFIKIIEHHNRGDKRKPDSGDQDFALKILVKIRDPDSVAPIAKMLERFFDRNAAVEALVALGPELTQAEVAKYVNHRDANVALAARNILAQFRTAPAVRMPKRN